MKSRLLVAAIGVPLILVVMLWAPVWVLAVMLAALAVIGGHELMKCVGAQQERPLCVLVALGAVLFIARDFFVFSDSTALRWSTTYFPVALVALTVLLFAYAVYRGGEVKFAQLCAGLFSVYAIPYAFAAFLRLYSCGYHRAFLMLPLIFSFCSDTFAFFAGLTMGKHKLAPKVSPKKTVEGAIGGLLGNMVGGVVFAWVMNTWYGYAIDWVGMAVLGLGCGVVAQLGDLSFSLIKREFGIKDYGKLFLAHGGVLDRFDSVLFVAPTLAVLMPWLM